MFLILAQYIVDCLHICQYLCFEMVLLIGIIFAPWIMIYVLIRSYKIIKDYIIIKLNNLPTITSSDRIRTSFSMQTRVNEKLEKHQVQILLLKFCLCCFQAIPQMIIKLYIYQMPAQHIYDSFIHHILFYISMISSSVAIFQFLYEMLFNIKMTHIIFISTAE